MSSPAVDLIACNVTTTVVLAPLARDPRFVHCRNPLTELFGAGTELTKVAILVSYESVRLTGLSVVWLSFDMTILKTRFSPTRAARLVGDVTVFVTVKLARVIKVVTISEYRVLFVPK